jgi:uncharacterized protein YutE (UPF0331/DUF86 family)
VPSLRAPPSTQTSRPSWLDAGFISEQLAARLVGLAGFRNLLVHDYAEVDAAKVRALLRTRLDDFTDFADRVDAWVVAQDS